MNRDKVSDTPSEKSSTMIGNIQSLLHKHGFLLALSLIVLPSFLGAIYIKLFAINVVFWDQWELVPLIEKLYTHTLTFSDLFAQHNEHRIFFPRIIMLGLAYITHYNTIVEMYFSWILVVITFIIIFKMYIQDFGKSTSMMIKFIPIAWIMFSFRQITNILWGWQIQIYLCVLGFVASIYLLEKANKINYSFILAILSGIISTFSFVNGLLVWPVGLIYIIISKRTNVRLFAAMWSIIGVLVWIIYFYDWTKPSHHPSLLFGIDHLTTSITYLIISVGSPLAFELGHAFGSGLIIMISLLILFIIGLNNKFTIGHNNRFIIENAKWISFVLFSLLSSAALMVGRSGFGIEQALSSRYVTLTSLGIIGEYLIITNSYTKCKNNKSQEKAILYGIILGIIVVGIVVGYAGGIKEGKNTFESRELMANNLIECKWINDDNLLTLYPNANIVRKHADILERYGLNVFYSNSNSMPDWNSLTLTKGGIMTIDMVDNRLYSNEGEIVHIDKKVNQYIEFTGWAADDLSKDGNVKTYLVFKNEDDEFIVPTIKTNRPDVANYFGVESYKDSGWVTMIQTRDFKDECYNISLRILRANGEEYLELNGVKSICFGQIPPP